VKILSKYTMELGIAMNSGFIIGLEDYPIFNENYREQLNNKIINHYRFHEIGFETWDRFIHYLNSTMGEIMPFYNQLLESELLKINPLLSFERISNTNKDIDVSTQEDLNNILTKTHDNITSKNIDNSTNQTIDNSTTLDNTTISSTDETQNRITDENQNTAINSSKNVDANNSSNEQNVFYDTPQGSLGDITKESYATTVTTIDKTNVIDENENINSGEDIKRDENINTIIDSDTTNTTNTNTTSNTSNSTLNNIDETLNIDINETNINESDNIKSTKTNEINVITENGFEIPLSELVLKYRETFLNVDLQIINELKDLFMMIY